MKVISIAEQLMFTTVRIETISSNGEYGVGTGFIFSISKEDNEYLFLVTNKHVVKDAKTGFLTFTLADSDTPSLDQHYRLRVNDFDKMFIGHDDSRIDVTVTPFVPILNFLEQNGIKIFYRSIGADLIPNKEQLEQLDALEDVVFIGYPNGIWDAKNNLPVIRRGITATSISIDFQGERQFLVDASVFPGSSGSPVFLYNAGWYSTKGGGTVVGSRIMLLGIITAVFYHEENGRIELINIPAVNVPIAVVKQMINLGIVFKADTIYETAMKIVNKTKS